MGVLGLNGERVQTARKEHKCTLCVHPILPGERYVIGITFPGVGRYQIAPDDYETVDWPFTWQKAHICCRDAEEYMGESCPKHS